MTLSSVNPADSLNRAARGARGGAGHAGPGGALPLAGLSAADFLGQLESATAARAGAAAVPVPDPSNAPALRPLSPLEMVPGVRGPVRVLKPLDGTGTAPLAPLDEADLAPGRRRRSREDEVTATARKWVAQTFYGTLLRQMRNSPFKSDLFEGGRGGQAFATLLDQHLADHMARGADARLVRSIARRLSSNRAGGAKPVPAPDLTPDPQADPRNHVPPGLRA